MQRYRKRDHRLTGFLLLSLMLLYGFSAVAQTRVVTFSLDNVALLPDITHPGMPSELLSGEFTWTYQEGDFENGVGVMKWIDVPWFGSDLTEMIIAMDTSSLEITLDGNWHDRGLDVSLKYLNNLSPDQPAVIDTQLSSFDIQNVTRYQGHVVDGAMAPSGTQLRNLEFGIRGSCPDQLEAGIRGAEANGSVAIFYSESPGLATIPGGYTCAGADLALNPNGGVATTMSVNAAGSAGFSFSVPPLACGRAYLQAIDLTACYTSDVILLQ